MGKWKFPIRQTTVGGYFQIVFTKPGYAPQDVTFFRNAPTQLSSYSQADPFGDSTAEIQFPQITVFDDPNGSDLVNWFGLFSNVDIWYVPGVTDAPTTGHTLWQNPLTNKPTAIAPGAYYVGTQIVRNRIKMWEGFSTSIEYSADETSHSLTVQCQGALFQLDRYLQKPYFPPRPQPLEKMFADSFDPRFKPHLRTQRMATIFPATWEKKVPQRNPAVDSAYVLDAKAGSNWTGYASRQTGSWEKTLTGFIQNQLALMITQPGYGVTEGQQWTIMQQRESGQNSINMPGRKPVLQIRATDRDPDFSIWLGTPGITVQLSRDGTQMANIAYGQGTSIDGTQWSNNVISNDGSRTDYLPLAYKREVFPYTGNKGFNRGAFVGEAYLNFGTGFSQTDATLSADTQLKREADPGWTGTITMKVDPSHGFSRWLIQAGMTVRVWGINGTGATGINLHIASIEAAVNDGTVTLTVDSRYRDLLTVQEAVSRTRDPLTPTRMLQPNKYSVLIQDLNMKWDYNAGSGYIPQASTAWWKQKPQRIVFPYVEHFANYPPKKHATWYVRVNANATARKDRWTRVSIRTAEKGTIRKLQIICVDRNGNILKIPFHFSLWSLTVTPDGMPRDKYGPSPYINNAFTLVNPATGLPWPQSSYLIPEPGSLAIYGSQIDGKFNRAGFYPGSEQAGSPASGILVDENPVAFDNTAETDKGYDPNKTVNNKQTAQSITLYGMFYAEYTEPVYFQGRMWRLESGDT